MVTDNKLYKVAITVDGNYVHGKYYDTLTQVYYAEEDGGDGSENPWHGPAAGRPDTPVRPADRPVSLYPASVRRSSDTGCNTGQAGSVGP